MTNRTLIAVGGNIPLADTGVYETVTFAIAELQPPDFALISQSRIFETPAYPAGSGPDYLNAIVEVATSLTPYDMLKKLHEIEESLGRKRRDRWESRVVDLDLLSYNDQILPDRDEFTRWRNMPLEAQKAAAPDQLILPHPRMHERAFVLVPLMDIAPDWVHPVLQLSVREMVANLPESDVRQIKPIE